MVEKARNIVLVHGAWQGSWAFDAWRPLLQATGWHVHAVDLPGNGWGPAADAPANLESYTEHVSSLLRRLDSPAVLVGHSGGGVTVSQIAEAEPERVAALVYLAGMMLPNGLSFAELHTQLTQMQPELDLAGISPWLEWNAGRTASTVREEGALRCFLQDCDPIVARRVASMLRPQPESGRAMRNSLTSTRFGRVPRLYIECLDDRSITLPLQRRMQALSPGAYRLSLSCGHVPQLVQPEPLSAMLMAALDSLSNANSNPSRRASFRANSRDHPGQLVGSGCLHRQAHNVDWLRPCRRPPLNP